MRLIEVLTGEQAVAMYGVCDCEGTTLVNQEWRIVEPDYVLPTSEGQHVFTRYVFCGFCGSPPETPREET